MTPDKLPIGSTLVHPKHNPGDPDACRIIKRAVTPGEWPWVRLTGLPTYVPSRWDDLSRWQLQCLERLAPTLGHPEPS